MTEVTQIEAKKRDLVGTGISRELRGKNDSLYNLWG